MSNLTHYKSIASRFRRVGTEQNEYKESYMIFSEFLLAIKRNNIDMAYIPYEFTQDVQENVNEMKSTITRYASTLGISLEDCPKQMREGLEDIKTLLGPAVEAADRLSRGEGTEVVEDWYKIKKLLKVAAAFAGEYSERCKEILTDISKFQSEELQQIQKNINSLVQDMEKSSSTYRNYKKNLKKEIEKLREIAEQYTAGAIASGVGVALFVVLGVVSVIASFFTGGAAILSFVALIAVGVPCLIGGLAIADFSTKAVDAQKSIDQLTAQMNDYDVSIAQVDLYADTYNTMLTRMDAVKNALTIMENEWSTLYGELEELAAAIEKGQASFDANEWGEVYEILKGMEEELTLLEAEIDKVDISKTTVAKTDLNGKMTEAEYQAACEGAEQVALLKYLRTA